MMSNDPETPSIPVMVTAWIRGDLTAAPSILALGQVNSSAAVSSGVLAKSVAKMRGKCLTNAKN